jgi:hypothetical protein
LRNNPTINKQINQKIVSEIKQVCANKTWSKNKKLFFNEDYLKELYPDYLDLDILNKIWSKLTIGGTKSQIPIKNSILQTC